MSTTFFEQFVQAPVRQTIGDCSLENGGQLDYKSLTGDGTTLILPSHFVPKGGLQFHGFLWSMLTGHMNQVNAGTTKQSFTVQMYVNSAASGGTVDLFPSGLTGTATTEEMWFYIEHRVLPLANADSTASVAGSMRQLSEFKMRVYNASAGTFVAEDTQNLAMFLDPAQEYDIGYSFVKKTPNPVAPNNWTSNDIFLDSITGFHMGGPNQR